LKADDEALEVSGARRVGIELPSPEHRTVRELLGEREVTAQRRLRRAQRQRPIDVARTRVERRFGLVYVERVIERVDVTTFEQIREELAPDARRGGFGDIVTGPGTPATATSSRSRHADGSCVSHRCRDIAAVA